MPELWIPQPDKHPDITNLYDMMMVFQEDLFTVWDDHELERRAGSAALMLARNLRAMPAELRDISLLTDIAIVDDGEENSDHRVVKDVGILGTIDDVYCISINDRLPMSLSLNLKVANVFEATDPDALSFAPSQAIVPIRHVRHIETLAS